MPPPPPFGPRLRALRTQAGLTVSALAIASGLHRTYIHALESGAKAPSWDVVLRLAGALGVGVEAFAAPESPPSAD